MVKRFFIIAILIVGGCLITKAQTSKYDLNGDGDVNVADVTELVDYILRKEDNSGDNPEGVVASVLVGIWTQYHTGGATAWYYGIKLDANGEAAYSEWDVKKSPNWTYTGGGSWSVSGDTLTLFTPKGAVAYSSTYSLSKDGKKLTLNGDTTGGHLSTLVGDFVKQ